MAIELDGFGDTMESHDEAQKSMDSGESTRPDGAGMTMLARTIRLCVVLVIDDLEFGGAQRQVVEVANNMDPARFDVHVCTLSDYVPLGSQLRDSATKLHTIVKKHKMDFGVVLRLARMVRTLHADIVHSYLFSADIASRMAGRLAGTPVVIGSERNTDYLPKKRHVLAYRLTRGCVDLTIANSRAGAQFNSKTYGQPIADYRVVYNGVDTERFKPQDKTAARAGLGIAASNHVVGVFASFKPQKNHAMALRAFARVLLSFPDARLLLVGDQLYGNMNGTADYHSRMEALIDELGIRQHCMFLGNRSDVELIYPACDVTVLSSWYEGTPNVLLESMACGVPVVATNVSDNSYVVKEGETGCVVELEDEEGMARRIEQLLTDAERRREMGQKARDWMATEFSLERLARNTEAVYLEALGRKRRG